MDLLQEVSNFIRSEMSAAIDPVRSLAPGSFARNKCRPTSDTIVEMDDLPKAARRTIRELADLAYERELAVELAKLRVEFDAWAAGGMTAFELEQAIHRFHQGMARELYNRYSAGSTLSHAVAAAILRSTIFWGEIPAPAREHLERLVAVFSELAREE
jgi:hypothetical protein